MTTIIVTLQILGFLDDFTLGGPAEVVARDVSKVVEIGGELGLSLNVSKCELVSHDGFTVTDSLLQSFPRTCIGDVTLPGAPLFPGPSLDRASSDRCAELARASGRCDCQYRAHTTYKFFSCARTFIRFFCHGEQKLSVTACVTM